jgi:alanyl-tRNA synthetase
MILLSSVSHGLRRRTVPLSDPVAVLGNVTAQVKAIYHDKSFVQSTSALPEDIIFGILLDRTSFYAESGGQEYDTGNIVIDGVADFQVTNVQVFSGYVLHIGHLKYGQIDVGNEVLSCYDEVRSSADISSTLVLISR